MKRTRLRRVSKKTRTQRWPVLKALREQVLARAKWRCEVPWCGGLDRRIDVHHIVKRSQSGPDYLGNLVVLCRTHHDMTDRAYSRGRLIITPLTESERAFVIRTAPDKWAVRGC